MIEIPEEIKKIALSIELSDQIRKVGESFDLHVDQIGELGAEIREILFGKKKSKDFINSLVTQLEINTETANKIAVEVNKNIFLVIKNNLQNKSLLDLQDNTSLETAGNFTVEPREGSDDHGMQNVETKDEVIAGIENPVPAEPRQSTAKPENHTDTLLIDHLLAGPIVSVEKKLEQKAPTTVLQVPKPSIKPQTKPNGPDLYREPV